MSGFEIVGVVLGALPILIEGLELYRKGLDTISNMKHYEETVENLVITFESTRARYIFTCETLLAPLMLPQGQYIELINNPGVKAWHDQDLQDALKDRLGPACDPYIGLVRRVHRALLKFAGKMEIEIQQSMKSRLPGPSAPIQGKYPSKIQSHVSTQSTRVWARVRIGLENGGLERLLEAMEKDLFRLERLLETSAKLPAIRKDRRRKLSKKPWQSVQESAQSLFASFTKRWHCSCQSSHNILLKLDVTDISNSGLSNPNFNIMMSKHAVANSNPQPRLSWYSLRVESQEDSKTTVFPSHLTTSQQTQGMKVTFQVTSHDDLGLNSISNLPPVSISSLPPEIDDLCSTLQFKKQLKYLGYLTDTGWRHDVSWDQSITSNDHEITKIYEILGGTSIHTKIPVQHTTLSTRQKYHLALSMSFALLNLFNTPWLTSHESFRNIHLVTSPQSPSQAYIMKSLRSNSNSTSQSPITTNTTTTSMSRVGVQNELLFQLGVLLLEIAYNKPLSQLRRPSDLDASGNETILTDYLVAVRLATEITQREPSKYSDAVRRCLYCRFTCTSTNLSDVELQEEFHAGVIVPLLEIYSVFG